MQAHPPQIVSKLTADKIAKHVCSAVCVRVSLCVCVWHVGYQNYGVPPAARFSRTIICVISPTENRCKIFHILFVNARARTGRERLHSTHTQTHTPART